MKLLLTSRCWATMPLFISRVGFNAGRPPPAPPKSGYTVTVWGSGVEIKATVNNLHSSSLRKRTSCNWASTSLDFTCVSFSARTRALTAASICRASIVSPDAAPCKSFIHGSLFRCPIFSRCTFPSSSSLNTNTLIVPLTQPAFSESQQYAFWLRLSHFCVVADLSSLPLRREVFIDLLGPTPWVLWLQWGISATDCGQVKSVTKPKLEHAEKVRKVAEKSTIWSVLPFYLIWIFNLL